MGDINRQKKTASHVFLLRYTHAHFCVHIPIPYLCAHKPTQVHSYGDREEMLHYYSVRSSTEGELLLK